MSPASHWISVEQAILALDAIELTRETTAGPD